MKKVPAVLIILLLLLQMCSLAWAWKIERPSDHITINDHIESSFSDGNAAVGLGIATGYYNVPPNDYGTDFVQLNVSMTANSRVGITYECESDSFFWVWPDELIDSKWYVGVGDNWGTWVEFRSDYSFYFRFYGGSGSGEYERAWICSNGFIALDNSTSRSSTPQDIPNTKEPNAIIAAVWTDLKIDDNAAIITGLYLLNGHYYFVVIWHNVLHKASGKRLTFEIILEEAPGAFPQDRKYGQSRIWISYFSVDSINTDFTFGIEDQQGGKGCGWGLCDGSMLGLLNHETMIFYQYSPSYFLRRLTLSFEDSNPDTSIDIDEDPGVIRGWNIDDDPNKPSEPDPTFMFLRALAGTAVLLIEALSPGGVIEAAGFMIDTVLVSLDWVDFAAYYQYSGRKVEVFDHNDFIKQQANISAFACECAVDASLCVRVHWILNTPHTEHHTLTITAKLEYYEYVSGQIIEKDPVTTSVVLEIGPDDNNDPSSADTISEGLQHMLYIGGYDTEDYYKIYLEKGYNFYVYLEETSSDHANIDIYLYDPNQVERVHKTLQPPPHYIYFQFTADSSGYWYIRVKLRDDHCFYSLFVGSAESDPPLLVALDKLGFTNVERSTVETFQPGVYQITLYAEFAGYHLNNTLCWYPVGSKVYTNVIFQGPEGEKGYVDPPLTKWFTSYYTFGLSLKTPEARYFTETSRNPDRLKHAQVYRSLDNPNIYFIGFENQCGQPDKDYNDMIIMLKYLRPPPPPNGGGGGAGIPRPPRLL